ncbi:hypothetical protein SKAU_G00208650 [Synaphobranchus kaupii]|uniref:Uncharacterized protein n=1 Tax=Synaphobranchus kaupii TaxID=118154 RepID=A0A9Q1IUT9_SYNKA|nr:hypothetical protein SKAU_G00208650 [Synaphobranchus kaupii]
MTGDEMRRLGEQRTTDTMPRSCWRRKKASSVPKNGRRQGKEKAKIAHSHVKNTAALYLHTSKMTGPHAARGDGWSAKEGRRPQSSPIPEQRAYGPTSRAQTKATEKATRRKPASKNATIQ